MNGRPAGHLGRIRVAAMTAIVCGAIAAGAIDAPNAAAGGFFGVVPQTELDAHDFDRMREGRIGTIRTWFSWPAIDPAAPSGDYDFSRTDALVAGAARERLRVLPFMFATPSWVATRLDHRSCGDCAIYAPSSPQALDAWRSFVAAAVARYGPGGDFWASHPQLRPQPIRTWQIWNEPNSREFFAPRTSPKAYARVLRTAAGAIAAEDRHAKVILGGMAQLAGSRKAVTGSAYLRRLYRIKGLRRQFDGVAVHPYGARPAAAIEQVEAFRAEMRRAGDRHTGLWVTEMGWSSARHGNPLNVGPRGQASRVRAMYGFFRRHRGPLGVNAVFWYSWMDAGGETCSWCAKSGLMRRGLRPKPSWRALTRFTGGR